MTEVHLLRSASFVSHHACLWSNFTDGFFCEQSFSISCYMYILFVLVLFKLDLFPLEIHAWPFFFSIRYSKISRLWFHLWKCNFRLILWLIVLLIVNTMIGVHLLQSASFVNHHACLWCNFADGFLAKNVLAFLAICTLFFFYWFSLTWNCSLSK